MSRPDAESPITSDQAGLPEILSDRLDQSGLSEESQLIVWAAIEGETALNQFVQDPEATSDSVRPVVTTPPTPYRAYLEEISAEGFRGIGPAASLSLHSGPGLTLVVGRNGSGKSSFAEAAEIALTGSNARLAGKTKIWTEGWRNLHAGGAPAVKLALHVDGDRGRTAVHRSWADDEVTASECWVQRPGERRTALAELGWEEALTTHRPFLSYAELGQLISGRPSDAYDAVASILGLDLLAAAEKRLLVVRKSLADEVKRVKSELDVLLSELGDCDDPRAQEALQALSGRRQDLDRVRALATGFADEDDPELAGLRVTARLEPPSQTALDAAVEGLLQAAAGLAQVRGTAADDARRLADLLQQAVDHRDRHRDQTACFVCGTPGMLDDEWARRTREEIERLQGEADQAATAHTAARQAVSVARRLMIPVPEWLPAGSPVRLAWEPWAAGAELADPTTLAEHITSYGPGFIEACTVEAEAAARQLTERADRWRPFAARLTAWLEQRQTAAATKRKHTAVQDAYKWLTAEGVELRNIRLAPLAHEAQQVWRDLRQQSNVDLGEIRLSGTTTRRSLDYSVEVDGVQAAALGVMSQGELHALALSIFLPRATVPESPFGFIVIDDPVQSMDPAKVDGLAQVLHHYARLRQVIVFTHDTRLPDAVRRLRMPATILQVVRRERSVVEVRTADDAVTQALEDARALTRTPGLPLNVAVPVVSGLCRTVMEAAISEVAWHRRLVDGVLHETVQDEVEHAAGFYGLASLALYGSLWTGLDTTR